MQAPNTAPIPNGRSKDEVYTPLRLSGLADTIHTLNEANELFLSVIDQPILKVTVQVPEYGEMILRIVSKSQFARWERFSQIPDELPPPFDYCYIENKQAIVSTRIKQEGWLITVHYA